MSWSDQQSKMRRVRWKAVKESKAWSRQYSTRLVVSFPDLMHATTALEALNIRTWNQYNNHKDVVFELIDMEGNDHYKHMTHFHVLAHVTRWLSQTKKKWFNKFFSETVTFSPWYKSVRVEYSSSWIPDWSVLII